VLCTGNNNTMLTNVGVTNNLSDGPHDRGYANRIFVSQFSNCSAVGMELSHPAASAGIKGKKGPPSLTARYDFSEALASSQRVAGV
jgi:hypothetical protein